MKVLLINFTDAGGGAAIAAVRLTQALLQNGIEATLAVKDKQTSLPFVIEIPKKKNRLKIKILCKLQHCIFSLWERIFNKYFFSTTNGIFHSTNIFSSSDIKWINSFDCDVINLHWICGTLSNKEIGKLNKPLVWTMHDSWPCCGAEHHPNILENDVRWKEGYTRNNKPGTTKGFDLCRFIWKQKNQYLSNKDIDFITPSNWEHSVLKSSFLFKNNRCDVIPNIIDQNVFTPKEKDSVRKLFNIPSNKKIIGFGAAYDIDNPKSMKGSYFLVEALQQLKNPENYFLVIFGPAGEAFTSRLNIEYFASGYISNTVIMSLLYNACDVFVNPSLIENLPTTSLESLFCGVPIVSFDVGGSKDIVVHKQTGYLATPYKAEEITEGIEYCIQNKKLLSENCIIKAQRDFDENEIIREYIDAYNSCLNR